VNTAVVKQRDDIRRLNTDLETQLKSRGMIFNYPENTSFREALSKAGFYQEWRGKFGDEAMSKLEKYSGRLA
jgi:TRAP-type C4-dicarboxylate transport system substrate-binding protein